MMRCSRAFLTAMSLTLAALALTSTGVAADTLLLESFEGADAPSRWEVAGEVQLSALHATDGRQSLFVRWPQGRGLLSGGFPKDWSGWEVLKVSCHNPGPPLTVTLRADDETGATASSWYHYLRTGNTVLEFSVPGLAESINLSRIRSAHIRVDPPRERPLELYFDEIRFCRDEPPEVYDPPDTEQTPIPDAAGSLIINGDFETGLTGWRTWGEWDGGRYEFGSGAGEDAHSGAASAAVICTRVGRGGLFTGPITIPATATWRLSFRVKATLGGRIRYGWVTSDAGSDLQEAQAGRTWQRVQLELPLDKGAQGQVHLQSLAPGTVFFDEVRLVPGGENAPAIAAEAVPGNRVKNPGFELGLHAWGSWGEWEDGLYEFGAGSVENAHTGQASAAVICNRKGRGGIFTDPMKLDADVYALRFVARATEPSTIRFGVIYPGGQMMRDADVGREWQTFDLTAESGLDGDWRVYLMSTGTGTVYFDEVTLVGSKGAAGPGDPLPAALGPPSKFELRDGHTYLSGEPFFALGMYRATPENLKGTAFNVIPGWDAPGAGMLDDCARNGIYALPDLTGVMRGHLPQQVTAVARPIMNHPAVLAWYLCDEPDHQRWAVPPDEMRLAKRLLAETDPNHPTCAVVMSWAESNLYRYADTMDILMTDVYPIGEKHPADLHRIADATAVMRRAVRDDRPIWTVIQATSQGTPEEHVGAAWLAIVEGADGLFFWEYEDAVRDRRVWDKVCEIADEIKSLRLVLTSPDAGEQARVTTSGLRTLVKNAQDGRYLIAVNGIGDDLGDCAIGLPGVADGPARVLFEDRSVRVSHGVLTDSFGPFSRHIYKLP